MRQFFHGRRSRLRCRLLRRKPISQYYEVKSTCYAGKDRSLVPCGIPYRCAHSGDTMGIVSGSIPQEQVDRMLKLALETPERSPTAWQRAVAAYDRETAQTFDNALRMQKPGLF